MGNSHTLSKQTQRNWLVNALLFSSALIAFISGIYFLFLPHGGFRGGRNPNWGFHFLFDRHTWSDLHTFSGLAMIVIACLHLLLHWDWVVNTSRRTFKQMTAQCGCLNKRGWLNLLVDVIVALSFFLTAVSGLYFFIVGEGIRRAPAFVFSAMTWNSIHTWSSMALLIAAVLHFCIHWRWIVKVTRKVFLTHMAASSYTPSIKSLDSANG